MIYYYQLGWQGNVRHARRLIRYCFSFLSTFELLQGALRATLNYFNQLKSIIDSYHLKGVLAMDVKTLVRKRAFLLIGLALVLTVTLAFGKPHGKTVDVKKPSAPSGFVVEESGDGLLASWHPSPGAKSYTLFWGTDKGEFRKMFPTTETSVLMKGFESGHLYNFAVTATNDSYESDFSTELFYLIDDKPKNSMEHIARAKDLIVDKRHNEALAFLNTAIRLDPNNPESYRTRGMLWEKLGEKEQAKQDFKKSETLFGHKQMTSSN